MASHQQLPSGALPPQVPAHDPGTTAWQDAGCVADGALHHSSAVHAMVTDHGPGTSVAGEHTALEPVHAPVRPR